MLKNKEEILERIKLLSDPRNVGLIAFGIVALLVTWSGVKTVQTNFELDKKISIAKQRNDIARLENENLKLKNTYYESDQFLELAARRQFGKAAPGEQLYLVPEEVAMARTVDMPTDEKGSEPAPAPKPKYQQNFEAWSEFLFR